MVGALGRSPFIAQLCLSFLARFSGACMAFGEASSPKAPAVVPAWVAGRTWARLPLSAIFSGELTSRQIAALAAVSACLQEGTDWTTVSASELGAMLGITRQGVNRHLQTLEALGYIRLEHRACATGFDDRRRIVVLYHPFEFQTERPETSKAAQSGRVIQFGDFQMPETAHVGQIEDGTFAKPEPRHGEREDGIDRQSVNEGKSVAPGATPIESGTNTGRSTSDEKREPTEPASPVDRTDGAESPDGDTLEVIEGRWSRPASLRYRGAVKSWVETHAPGLSGHKLVADFKKHWEGRPWDEGKDVFDTFKGWVRNAVARSVPYDEREPDGEAVPRTAADMIPPPDADLKTLIDPMSERAGVVLDIVRRLARTMGAQTFQSYLGRGRFDLAGKVLTIDAPNRLALERLADRFAPKIGAILADELGKGWKCFVRNDGVQHEIAPRKTRG